MKRFVMLTVLMLTVLMVFSGPALAKEKKAAAVPDATLELKTGQVAIGIGYSWGEGVLTYQGKTYTVKVKGLSVVDVGVTKARAKGNVYNLKKIEDFDGNYTTATAEGTIGGGVGATNMNNQNGVKINLVTTTKGVNLKLAASGVELSIKK
jgi:hypothetical protein